MAQNWLPLIIVVVMAMSQGVIAKRGCSAFGHSCFGGHGKRSDTPPLDPSSNEILGRKQLGQEEIPPHPGYPRSGYGNLLAAGDDIIPVRDGGVFREEAARDLIRFKLRNIVKQWMEKNRRSKPLTDDDSYFTDSI